MRRNRRRIVLMGGLDMGDATDVAAGGMIADMFGGGGSANPFDASVGGASSGADALANAQAQSNADLLARQADVQYTNELAANYGVTPAQIHAGPGVQQDTNTGAPATGGGAAPKAGLSSAGKLALFGGLAALGFWIAKKKHLIAT